MPQLITQRVRDLRKSKRRAKIGSGDVCVTVNWSDVSFTGNIPIKVNHDGKNGYYIADFYCHEKKLVIEVDGKIHENQTGYDEHRTFVTSYICYNKFFDRPIPLSRGFKRWNLLIR